MNKEMCFGLHFLAGIEAYHLYTRQSFVSKLWKFTEFGTIREMLGNKPAVVEFLGNWQFGLLKQNLYLKCIKMWASIESKWSCVRIYVCNSQTLHAA